MNGETVMKNNDTALVSVVIPIYNVEKYLRECVDSVLAQTYTDLEIILVDDGSPDNCGKICDEYAAKDRRVKVIHKENGGQSDARNAGIDAAHGEYIFFVDSDDYIEREAVEELIKAAEKSKADIVFYNAVSINEATSYKTESMIHSLEYPISPGTDVLTMALQHKDFFSAVCLNFYNAGFFKKNGFRFKKRIYFEDFLLHVLAYIRSERVCYLKKSLYYYRIRNNSAMTSEPEDRHFNGLLSCIATFRKEIKSCSDKKRIKALELSILHAADLYMFEFSRLKISKTKSKTRELGYLRCVERQLSEINSKGLKLKLMFPELFYIYRKALFPLKDRIIKTIKGVQS